MGDSVSQQTTAKTKPEEWAERIAAQQRSGVSVKQFCREQGLSEYSFYAWRKRLRENQPVRFALVERPRQQPAAPTAAVVEVVLRTGERLLIGAGIDGPTLGTVLDALRA